MRVMLFFGSAALVGACASVDAFVLPPDGKDSTKDGATVDATTETDATTKDAVTDAPLDATSEEVTGPDGATQDAGADPDARLRCEAGCRLFSSNCNGCACLSLPQAERNPSCDGGMVACLVDPCKGKAAVCTADGCVVQ